MASRRQLAVGVAALVVLGVWLRRPSGPPPAVKPAAVTQPGVAEVVRATSAVSLDLLRASALDQNAFVSGYGVTRLMSLAYAGARGLTAEQMRTALHFGADAGRQLAALTALDGAIAADAKACGATYHAAEALWVDNQQAVLPAYLALARRSGVALDHADLSGSPDASAQRINEWVGQATRNQIRELIEPSTIKPDTRLVGCDAVYFQARWSNEFKRSATQPRDFSRPGGSKIQVPTMFGAKVHCQAAYGDTWRAVDLPYRGDVLSMLLVTSDTSYSGPRQSFEPADFVRLSAEMDEALLAKIVAALVRSEESVILPRLSFGTITQLVPILKARGMSDAFTMAADFAGIDPTRMLFLGEARQRARLTVDEDGTTAAAATFFIAREKGAEAIFALDRPFYLFLRHRPSGAILFAGRVADPSKLSG